MPAPTHTLFKDGGAYFDAGVSDQLRANLANFLAWAFLNIGAFENVERNTLSASGAFGGDRSRLRLSEDPYYTSGQVWDGFRRDWVWETGIEFGTQPIRVSGVYVGGTFYSTAATGAYAHNVDYANGRVIFTNAISPSSVVQVNHTFRYVHVTTSDAPFWREWQQQSLRVDDPHFLQSGSGNWSAQTQSRVQLPAVVVESVPRTRCVGLALGGGVRHQQDVLFNVVAETPWDRDQIHDRLIRQHERRMIAFDKTKVIASGVYGLDGDGFVNPSGLMYPDLISPEKYGWKQVRVVNTSSDQVEADPPLYPAIVRWTCEMDLP